MEKINIVPTWPAALHMALTALEDGNAEGKKSAKELLQQMAEVAQISAETTKFITNKLAHAEEDEKLTTYERGVIDAYTNILNLYNR